MLGQGWFWDYQSRAIGYLEMIAHWKPLSILLLVMFLTALNGAALGSDPVDAKTIAIHEILFRIAFAQRRLLDAEAEIRACLTLAPDNACCHYQYAQMLWTEQKTVAAIIHFKAAARLAPENVEYQRTYRWAESRLADPGYLHIQRAVKHETTPDDAVGDFGTVEGSAKDSNAAPLAIPAIPSNVKLKVAPDKSRT